MLVHSSTQEARRSSLTSFTPSRTPASVCAGDLPEIQVFFRRRPAFSTHGHAEAFLAPFEAHKARFTLLQILDDTDICALRTSFACAKDQWRECSRRTSGQAAKMLPRPKHKSSSLALSTSTRVIVKDSGEELTRSFYQYPCVERGIAEREGATLWN